MKKYIGRIKSFIFSNEESRFAVATFSLMSNEKKTIVISGSITSMKDGVIYEIEGDTVIDALKKRSSFIVESFSIYESDEKDYLVKFISSPSFPTIGKILAEKIIDGYQNIFKENILEKIKSHPEHLKEFGATEIQQEIILSSLDQFSLSDLIENEFNQFGLNTKFLTVLFREIVDETERENILKNDFYNFAFQFSLAPFEDVDAIALHYGVEKDSNERVSWIAWNITRERLEREGGTYTNFTTVKKELQKRFGLEINLTEKLLYAKEEKIIYFKNGDKIYTQESFEDEMYIASKIKSYSEEENYLSSPKNWEDKLSHIESSVGKQLKIPNFKYNVEQKEALKKFVSNSFQIVTGGPGTGKTTVILGMIELFRELYSNNIDDIAVVAPTGRAASRISESTGFNAITIHRLLKFAGGKNFNVNEESPLYKKILIVDESSMIDQFLFAKLLRGIKGLEKIILVGDPNQLPSVGYGNVFEDLIQSEAFNITRLKINNRQSDREGNGIIELSRAINEERIDEFNFTKYENLKLFDAIDPTNKIREIMRTYVVHNANENISDVQLVTAMNAGMFGVNGLNNKVQDQFIEKNTITYKRGDFTFHVGDKVICIENNAEKQIYNGDMGIIEHMKIGKKTLEYADIRFGDRLVQLSNIDFNAIKLAYACTIHKTQGSEFKNVLLVIDQKNEVNKNFMINKKLLYTAVTRAKENIYLFANPEAFKKFAKREQTPRKTTLKELLVQPLLTLAKD